MQGRWKEVFPLSTCINTEVRGEGGQTTFLLEPEVKVRRVVVSELDFYSTLHGFAVSPRQLTRLVSRTL